MKNLSFYLLFGGAVVLFLASCTKNDSMYTSTGAPSLQPSTQRSMVAVTGSPYFSYRHTDVDDQTWNGSTTNPDCADPAKDCAVITPTEVANSDLFSEFDAAVSNGSADDLYANGNGNLVMTLKSGAYNDLQNGYMDFYKYAVSGRNLYVFK